jgi:membrane fusion protein
MYGEIVMRSEWISWVLTAGVFLFTLGMMVLIFYGEYTRRAGLSGYLIPMAGVVRIHSSQAGNAAIVHVKEGDVVKAGQPLVTVVDERLDAQGREARGRGTAQIQARQVNFASVIAQQKNLYIEANQGLTRRIAAITEEMAQLKNEQRTQASRIALSKATHKRWVELLTKNYVSENAVQEKLEIVTDQEAKLQTMERGYTSLRRELETMQAELAALPMRERTQIAELERGVTTAEQELIEMQTRRELVVTAPQAGRVSGLTVKPSQIVNPERPLMMLLPLAKAKKGKEGELEAHLFAQSKDAGFVRAGQEVLLRYSAYPYQKFGHYKGTVVEVSATPLLPAELPFPVSAKAEPSALASLAGLGALASGLGNDPVFRIRVQLGSQSAKAYGVQQALQSGMQLEADVMLDRRTIFEWIMEPLYALNGKYFE